MWQVLQLFKFDVKVAEGGGELAQAQAAYESCTPEEQLAIWEAYYQSQNAIPDPNKGGKYLARHFYQL